MKHVSPGSVVLATLLACTAGGRGSTDPDRQPSTATTAGSLKVWRERGAWTLPAEAGDARFGRAIVVKGDVAAITAPGTNHPVTIYRRDGLTWTAEAELAPAAAPDPGAGYGIAVAMSGDRVAVGAPLANRTPSGRIPGGVWVFERTGSAWTTVAELAPDDAAAADDLDGFGQSVALDGDTLVVGAPHHKRLDGGSRGVFYEGAVYVYTRSSTGDWSLRTKLAGGERVHDFGASLALSGSTLVVGAGYVDWLLTPAVDASTSIIGEDAVPPTAHFFNGAAASWTREHVAEGEMLSRFGASVTLDGDTAVVGEPVSFTETVGSAHVFVRSGAGWARGPRLRPHDSSVNDVFGNVVLHGDRLAVGAVGANDGKGAVYVFDRRDGGWSETSRLVAADALLDDRFGASFDFTADMLLAGGPERERSRGRAYAFYLGYLGEPCSGGEACATGLCVDGVCCDSLCGGGDTLDCLACSVAAGGATDGTCGVTKPRVCRPATGECDVADSCDGVNPGCAADLVVANGTSCNGGAGTCSSGDCVSAAKPPAPDAEAGRVPVTASGPTAAGCAVSDTTGNHAPLRGAGVLLAAAAWIARRRRR